MRAKNYCTNEQCDNELAFEGATCLTCLAYQRSDDMAMVRVITDKTNLQKGWIYPMIRIDSNTWMLHVDSMAIMVTTDQIRRVDGVAYMTVLRHAQPRRGNDM